MSETFGSVGTGATAAIQCSPARTTNRSTPKRSQSTSAGSDAKRKRGRPRGSGERHAETILAASRSLFLAQGFDRTSLRQIARKADVNVALIHYYFGSKEGLLQETIESLFKDDQRRLQHYTYACPFSIGELVTALFAPFQESPHLAERMLAATTTDQSSPESRYFRSIHGKRLHQCEKILHRMQNNGLVLAELDLETLAATLLYLTQAPFWTACRIHPAPGRDLMAADEHAAHEHHLRQIARQLEQTIAGPRHPAVEAVPAAGTQKKRS